MWNKDNIYLMDNHLLALWCWLQEIKEDSNGYFNLLHIDAHYDCDPCLYERWKKEERKKLLDLTLSDYLNLKQFKWDNYLPVFFSTFGNQIHNCVAMTHGIGVKGEFKEEIECYDILKRIDDLLLFEKNWIINIDFDYFFARSYKKSSMYSKDYIKEIFKLIKLNYDMGHIKVLTACLSPECCGGWEQALSILELFCQEFEIDDADVLKNLVEKA